MKYCEQCGTKINDSSAFCTKCGNKVGEDLNSGKLIEKTRKNDLYKMPIIGFVIPLVLELYSCYINSFLADPDGFNYIAIAKRDGLVSWYMSDLIRLIGYIIGLVMCWIIFNKSRKRNDFYGVIFCLVGGTLCFVRVLPEICYLVSALMH